jgi:uncharacterized membrane protein
VPRWLAHAILTVLLFGAWGVLPRLQSQAVTAGQYQALSTLGVLPVIAGLCFARGLRRGSAPGRGATLAFVAGLIVSGGNVAYFHALQSGDMAATVIAVTALYPVVTVLLSLVFLGERLHAAQVAGVLLALAAIYLFNVGGSSVGDPRWLLFALLPIGLWGLAAFLQKLSAIHASSELATLAFLAAFVPAALVLLWLKPLLNGVSSRELAIAAAIGATFALGNWTFLAAFAAGGKASIVTPLVGLYPAVSVPVACFVLGDRLATLQIVAIGISFLATIGLAIEKKGPPCEPSSNASSRGPSSATAAT